MDGKFLWSDRKGAEGLTELLPLLFLVVGGVVGTEWKLKGWTLV